MDETASALDDFVMFMLIVWSGLWRRGARRGLLSQGSGDWSPGPPVTLHQSSRRVGPDEFR